MTHASPIVTLCLGGRARHASSLASHRSPSGMGVLATSPRPNEGRALLASSVNTARPSRLPRSLWAHNLQSSPVSLSERRERARVSETSVPSISGARGLPHPTATTYTRARACKLSRSCCQLIVEASQLTWPGSIARRSVSDNSYANVLARACCAACAPDAMIEANRAGQAVAALNVLE